MNYYLVDYENVRTQGLNGVNKLSEEDIVCIFYTEHADSLTFGLHRRLNESKATILFRRVIAGYKNALDFQLSSYLGYIICENAENQYDYCIVSQDKGYESLVDYWKKRKVNVSLVTNVVKQKEQASEDKAETQEDALSPCEKVAEEYSRDNTASEEQTADLPKDRPVVSATAKPEIQKNSQTQAEELLFFDKMIRDYLQSDIVSKEQTAEDTVISTTTKQEVQNNSQTQTEEQLFLNKVLKEYFQSDIVLEEKETVPASDTSVVPVTVQQKKRTMDNDLEKQVAKLLKDKSDAPAVTKILQNCKTKMELNNALMKKFPSKDHKKSSEIYTALKPLIADKKGN